MGGRTEVLKRKRAGVEDEPFAAGSLDARGGDEGVRDVAHVDVLRGVAVELVGVARGRDVAVHDLRGEVEGGEGRDVVQDWLDAKIRITIKNWIICERGEGDLRRRSREEHKD